MELLIASVTMKHSFIKYKYEVSYCHNLIGGRTFLMLYLQPCLHRCCRIFIHPQELPDCKPFCHNKVYNQAQRPGCQQPWAFSLSSSLLFSWIQTLSKDFGDAFIFQRPKFSTYACTVFYSVSVHNFRQLPFWMVICLDFSCIPWELRIIISYIKRWQKGKLIIMHTYGHLNTHHSQPLCRWSLPEMKVPMVLDHMPFLFSQLNSPFYFLSPDSTLTFLSSSHLFVMHC